MSRQVSADDVCVCTSKLSPVADFASTKETSPRQAFFTRFAHMARECLRTNFLAGFNAPLVLLTGGLRSPAHLQTALDAGDADLLGVGRGSILRPDIPAVLQERILRAATIGTSIALDDNPFVREPGGDVRLPSWVPQIPLVGAGVGMAWYNVLMRGIARSRPEEVINDKIHRMGRIEAIVRMWVWIEWQGCRRLVTWLCWCIGGGCLVLMLFAKV